MAVTKKKEHNVSDPGHYDPLIADQKRRVHQYPHDAQEWLELGRLLEDKIDLINYLVKGSFVIRHFLPIYSLLFSMVMIVSAHQISSLNLLPWQSIGFISLIITIMIVVALWMLSLRYPPSGKKYFRKAIALDPNSGEAYLYLGLIALRRHQKRKACCMMEQAIRLNVDDNRIERELKSIYEKEFVAFFNKKTEKEVMQQEIIDNQVGQIRELCLKVSSLESQIESQNKRTAQAKWEANYRTKSLKKEMTDRIAAIRQDYKDQIAILNKNNEARDEAKELAERDFMRLTTEIMEAKAELEGKSLAESAKTVEHMMGTHLWQALLEQTRSYLATAEQIHTVLIKQEEKPDFSLVGMELCKALETEINRTFVEPFVEYLNESSDEFLKINRTGDNKNRPFYFTYLANIVDGVNFPEVTALTLGQYHFVLKRTLDGEYALKEYCNFLDEVGSAGAIIGKAFLKKLVTVTKKYRNAIAHHAPMNKKQYEHLRELIFAGDEALLRTCSLIQMRDFTNSSDEYRNGLFPSL